jgi:alanyl-tRNA synthetase
MDKPFLADVCDAVRAKMEGAYPELAASRATTAQVVKAEEERFSETLETGLRLLSDELAALKAAGAQGIPGDLIFRLYDTYGFPVDIINDVARTEGLSMDLAGFERHMERQKEMSRQAGLRAGEAAGRGAYRRLIEAEAATQFLGYDRTSAPSEVLLLAVGGAEVPEAGVGQEADIVCAATPFYGASGGQVGDTGKIAWPGGEAEVFDAVKADGLIIHRARITKGTLERGRKVRLEVDPERRQRIALNHTATHLLQAVLRANLGEHVKQAGSLVSPDRLRFDFTHFAPLEAEVLRRVEDEVNAAIRADMEVKLKLTTYEEAVREGAMALFEDKYAGQVRLIEVASQGRAPFSRELCGGTHTRHTGEIGLLKIASEGGIAAGVRRIEALTGPGALDLVHAEEAELRAVAELVRADRGELIGRIEKLLANQKRLEKELERARTSGFGDQLSDLIERGTRQAEGVSVTAVQVPAANPKELREMADRMRDKVNSGVVVLGAAADGKAMLVVTVSKDLAGRYSASDIVKRLAEIVGGTGGGRPDMAQAGGSRPEKLAEAIDPDRVKEIVLEVGKK